MDTDGTAANRSLISGVGSEREADLIPFLICVNLYLSVANSVLRGSLRAFASLRLHLN